MPPWIATTTASSRATSGTGAIQSFRVHDWNGDGVLSGEELRPGAHRPGRPSGQDDYTGPDTYRFSDWTESGFRGLDRNRDGRLSRQEWCYDSETFTRMDANRDSFVSLREFLGTTDDDRDDRFEDLDANGDGHVTWAEWHGGREAFAWLDRNGDGVLTRAEIIGSQSPQAPDTFATLDVNRDGRLSRDEWQWSQGSFANRDRNGDGVVTRARVCGSDCRVEWPSNRRRIAPALTGARPRAGRPAARTRRDATRGTSKGSASWSRRIPAARPRPVHAATTRQECATDSVVPMPRGSARTERQPIDESTLLDRPLDSCTSP